jgi:hypothetical protein
MFIRAQSLFILCASGLKFAWFFRDEGIRVVKFTFPFFVTLAISPIPAWWGKFFLWGILRLSQAAVAAAATDAAAASALSLA